MTFETKIAEPGAKRMQRLVACAFLFALVALLFELGQFLADALTAIRFPWEMDYGEGIVWEQMRLMLAGRGYGSIDSLPAIVFHYPPVYHLLTAALTAASGLDPLAVGRSLSITATLLIGLFAGLIAARTVRADESARTAAICGAVAGLALFCFTPIAFWAPLMRVDMVSIALSFAGLFVGMRALERPGLIAASAALFVAAVFTKQTAIVAPAALFLTFLLLRPRSAWFFAAWCVGLGLIVLGVLAVATDGGFLRHILLYNANRFDARRLPSILVALITHSFFITVLAVGIAARLRERLPLYRGAGSIAVLRQRLLAAPGDAHLLLILTYAALATVTTLGIAKSGSNINYFMEWMAVLAILVGIVARDAARALAGRIKPASGRLFAAPFFVPLLIGLQPLLSSQPDDLDRRSAPERVAGLEQIDQLIRAAPRPVVSDDMVMLRRAGVDVQWEPAILAELSSTGQWDDREIVRQVRAGDFAFFVTAGKRGDRLFDSRYNPALADAIDAAYPVKRKLAGYMLHFPAPARP